MPAAVLRLYVTGPLLADTELALPPAAVRHAQVRRVQPGDPLQLFDGSGRDWPAQVLRVGRQSVEVRLGTPWAVDNELPLAATLALGMPANERMDALVEKAAELGVARIQPLMCERSVLRLSGERADRKREHWQAIAGAACEQCGRAVVPEVAPVMAFLPWLTAQAGWHGNAGWTGASATQGDAAGSSVLRLVLSLQSDAVPLSTLQVSDAPIIALSGPEGGLSSAEEAAARAAGFGPISLGRRILRADTAPLTLLAWFSLQHTIPAVG